MSEFNLTIENYYSEDRPHWSTSQINDYLKSPEYFFKKYIERSIPRSPSTPSMKVGSFVDAKLTNPEKAKNFKIAPSPRGKDAPFNLTKDDHAKAIQIADHVFRQPFWQDNLDKAIFQMPLAREIEIPLLTGGWNKTLLICGLPDRMDWREDSNGKYLHIQDLKVVAPSKITSPEKWWWNAVEMGYVNQGAMYRDLAAYVFKIPKERIRFSHIVATQIDEGYCEVRLFDFPASALDNAEIKIKEALVGIARENWSPELRDWASAEFIGITKKFEPEEDEV